MDVCGLECMYIYVNTGSLCVHWITECPSLLIKYCFLGKEKKIQNTSNMSISKTIVSMCVVFITKSPTFYNLSSFFIHPLHQILLVMLTTDSQLFT